MADAMMMFLGEAHGVNWYWAQPGEFENPGVYYWDGAKNVLCVPRLAAAPEAPAQASAVDERAAIRSELLNTPELHNFSEAVTLEALHQRERWGSEHDAGKDAADWFWLVGYLAGKVVHAQASGNTEKALHHTISAAAALANWHAAILGAHTAMRPGIDGEAALAQKGAA